MLNGEQARERGVARLLVVGAALLGLFLMHGSPANAAGGCHGAMRMAAPMHQGHHVVAPMSAKVLPAGVHPEVVLAPEAWGSHGSLCVSTPARDWAPLAGFAVVVFLTVLAACSLPGRPISPGAPGRRGPPTGGRDLLLRVCVARN